MINASLIALAVLTISITLFMQDRFRLIENWVADVQMKVYRADIKASDEVVVLLIDEASLAAMDPLVGRWPWPRSVWADVIEYMAMGQAQSVVFDILFTERDLNAVGEITHHDQALVDMTAQTDFVTHALQILYDPYNPYANKPLPEGFIEKYAFSGVQGLPLKGNNTFYTAFNPLQQVSHRMGVVEFSPDSDGVYRRTQLFRDYQDVFFPVLSMAPMLDRMDLKQVRYEKSQVHFDELAIPLDRNGFYQVNFYSEFQSYSLASVLASISALRQGNLEALYTDERLLSPEVFQNKVVFIGTSAVGLEDLKTTPIDSRWPGVFLHASIVSNFINQDFINQAPVALVVAVMVLVGIAVLLMVLFLSSLIGQLILPMVLISGLTLSSFLLFGYQHYQFDLAPTVTVALATWLLLVGYFSATEGQEKRRVRQMLAQYVSPAALNDVVDNYEDQLEAKVGREVEVSIVFSDVRSFTSISENLNAKQVVEMLNIHLERMTEITFEHKGTMDKFIGDATMAFWGAPLPDAHHAYNATCAAVHMARAMPEVNATLKDLDMKPIRIGVGVNTGHVVQGNIGSKQKLDYTIIGDAVNLGSRLEALTKEYGLDVLISEFTYSQLNGRIFCAPIDFVRVKGRQEPLQIFTPFGLDTDPASSREQAKQTLDIFEQAFKKYHHAEFDQAKKLYAQLPERFATYKEKAIARCDYFIANPPPSDWDGVFVQVNK
jgi:adenylate cyclase